ncbi:MAG: DUF4342 domain-containing protein [Gemmatimonadales bacterium]|jgi:hypothetical protein|nr:DUF4342 domain-containing protein [Gemmatimonadales bacterium]
MPNDLIPVTGRAIVNTTEEQVHTEQHMVAGDRLVERIKELVRQGNIRRIHVKNDEGRTIMEIPLTVGVVGAVLMPVWVALGAIAALAASYTIEVEKVAE